MRQEEFEENGSENVKSVFSNAEETEDRTKTGTSSTKV